MPANNDLLYLGGIFRNWNSLIPPIEDWDVTKIINELKRETLKSMPKEYTLLKDQTENFSSCPKCKTSPFKSFMRGQIQREKYFFRKKYCAVICNTCKERVGWEGFTKKEKLARVIGLNPGDL